MNYEEKYQEYIDFLEANGKESERRQANAFSAIGKYDYTDCNEAFIKNVVLSCTPQKGDKSVTNITYIMTRFAKYIGDKHLEQVIRNTDRSEIWDIAKEYMPDRYISYAEFREVIKKILVHEDNKVNLLNSEYYAALFWCIYEGIYSKDYSLLANLRASNINKRTIITYDNDGNDYKFVVPKELANLLIKLSKKDLWETTISNIGMIGKYQDSCFKICQRPSRNKQKNKERITDSYRTVYGNRHRTIVETYIKRKLSEQEVYVSGIMRRIVLKAEKYNINWKDIFKEHNRNSLHNNIILQELKHSNYQISIRSFREMVKNYLYVFDE